MAQRRKLRTVKSADSLLSVTVGSNRSSARVSDTDSITIANPYAGQYADILYCLCHREYLPSYIVCVTGNVCPLYMVYGHPILSVSQVMFALYIWYMDILYCLCHR